MPQSPDIKRQAGQYVGFQFPEHADVTVTIRVHERYTRKGRVISYVIYDSEEDERYDALVAQMAKAAGAIIENNFADGRDETVTPGAVTEQLDALKALVRSFDRSEGHRIAFSLLGKAQAEVFTTQRTITELGNANRLVLKEILRWHIEEAINTPQPTTSQQIR